MTCPAGSIIHIEHFILRNGSSKDKYFVVLSNSKDNALTLLSMTTSNESGFYFNFDDIKIQHGEILDSKGKVIMYCMPKHVKVGINQGFCFPKDTFFLAQYCFSEVSCEQLNKYTVKIKDEVSREELNNLVYTLYKSPYIVNEFKKKLELILEELNS
jgi:hypothetical protein